MLNLFEMIQQAQNGAAVDAMAKQFDLTPKQAEIIAVATEYGKVVLSLRGLAQQDAAGLRHALEHEGTGHHREAGVMVVQMLFGQRDVLDRHGTLA